MEKIYILTKIKMVEYIHCTNCNKLIEKKGQRTMCIRCTNVWNKIQAEKRRATQEYKDYQRSYKQKRGM